jgi:RimJ/RimL family protein N-acetyltransferase
MVFPRDDPQQIRHKTAGAEKVRVPELGLPRLAQVPASDKAPLGPTGLAGCTTMGAEMSDAKGWLQPITLQGVGARLEPLDQRHRAELIEAVSEGELWRLWYTNVPAPERMHAEIERRLGLQAAGAALPFAVIDTDTAKAGGMTSYLNADAANRRLEIGATWYRQSLQRTAINTRCKMLLLQHAFETLRCIAVEFRTHFFNHQSRRAIARLGAKLDGILRNHQLAANGTLRDTCVYSIIAGEWPTVQSHLAWLLDRPREDRSPRQGT